MKRVFTVCLAICLLLSLAACGEKHEHAYKEKVTPPSCTEEGYTTYTCECGDSYKSDTVGMLGHSFADATCTVAKTCTTCGVTEGAALGHNFTDATCTAVKTCATCGITEGGYANHTWVNATCQAPKTCSYCKLTEGSVVDHAYKDGACTMCGGKDPKVQQISDASYAYEVLLVAEEYCELFADMIYDAWYFAIYKSDNYSSGSSAISAFASYVGINSSIVTEAVDSYLNALGYSASDIYRLAALSTNGGALYVVDYALTKTGGFAGAQECLDEAKAKIQGLDKDYASVNAYSELTSYYSAVKTYFDFCYSPSGSFSQLSGKLNTFRDECGFYRNKCSLYF